MLQFKAILSAFFRLTRALSVLKFVRKLIFREPTLKALYIHGFGSFYDPDSEKVQNVKKVFDVVVGIDLDYTQGFDACLSQAHAAIARHKPDVLIGTSMGGHLVTHLSQQTGLPFMAMNPAPFPSTTLASRIGPGTDYRGNDYVLEERVVKEYPDISLEGNGVVFVEKDDKVIIPMSTWSLMSRRHQVVTYPGGSHRFTRSFEAAVLFKEFVSND